MPPSGAFGRQLHHAAGQRAIPNAYRHNRRFTQLRADRSGARSRQYWHTLGGGQPDDLLDGAWTGVLCHDHAPTLSCLQLFANPIDPNDHPAPSIPEAEEAQQPVHALGRDSSPLSSSVSSDRNAISWSAVSGVIPGILVMSSRSRSRMSFSILYPALSRIPVRSGDNPFSSLKGTLPAISSSGGRGANSGPSPPRSSHSRLEYRSIFQPVSSEASRTFCPLRPMASES